MATKRTANRKQVCKSNINAKISNANKKSYELSHSYVISIDAKCLRFIQVLDNAIEGQKMIDRYEALASELLEWIEKTIGIISNQKFANSLTGVQQQLQAFTTYCTIEKPIK